MRLRFEDLAFDPETRRVWLGDREARLSPKAFDLLALLIAERPRAVPKADIHERLWPGTFVSDSSLPSLVSEIREAIADRGRERPFIRTLHGRGYAFEAPEPERTAAASGPGPDGWLLGADMEIPLFAGDNLLGREGPGVIVLKSSTVSRCHARIVVTRGGAVVEDLGSKNGTYVNDRRLHSPTPVVAGDQVRIGSLLFTFRPAQPAGATETVASHSSRRSGS